MTEDSKIERGRIERGRIDSYDVGEGIYCPVDRNGSSDPDTSPIWARVASDLGVSLAKLYGAFRRADAYEDVLVSFPYNGFDGDRWSCGNTRLTFSDGSMFLFTMEHGELEIDGVASYRSEESYPQKCGHWVEVSK